MYTATTMVEGTRSHELLGGGFLLTRELVEWFAAQYVAGADPSDPRLSVPHAQNLSGVAPALVVTAGFDPLRDEGEAYAGGCARRACRSFSGVSPALYTAYSTPSAPAASRGRPWSR